ncbi:hypothetical protein G6F59_018513 [Rhizopus arrhizus]|nr:hypothetical protein G6F59_018513 [Rhizopus arrhizus]
MVERAGNGCGMSSAMMELAARAAGGGDHGVHVGERLAHLGVEVFGDQIAGARLQADLAREVDSLGAANGNRLRVRANGGGRGVGMDDLLAHGRNPSGDG